MIQIRIIVACLLLFGLLGAVAVAETTSGETKPAAEQKAKQKAVKHPAVAKGSTRASMKVEMCCAHGCPVHVHETVGEMEGVTYVKADYDTQTVTVDYRTKQVKLQAIKDAILALGYPVDGQQPEEPHSDA